METNTNSAIGSVPSSFIAIDTSVCRRPDPRNYTFSLQLNLAPDYCFDICSCDCPISPFVLSEAIADGPDVHRYYNVADTTETGRTIKDQNYHALFLQSFKVALFVVIVVIWSSLMVFEVYM